MPLPLLLFAAAKASSWAGAYYFAGGAGTAGVSYFAVPYVYDKVRDWADPARIEERRHDAILQREAREWVSARRERVAHRHDDERVAITETLVATHTAMDTVRETQQALGSSAAAFTDITEEASQSSVSLRVATVSAEDLLRESHGSLRLKEEELHRINERLRETEKMLAEKEALLERQALELIETNKQLSASTKRLSEAEISISMLTVEKNKGEESLREMTGLQDGSSGSSDGHRSVVEALNSRLADATRRMELLAQENKLLSKDNDVFSGDKEKLVKLLVEAHETIADLEGKLEAASAPRPTEASPRFFAH